MKPYFSLILIAILVTACQSSAEQITSTDGEAQARTQTAAPTLPPSETPTSESSGTPEATASPTPVTSCGDGQEVDVTHGTFDCKEYISADHNFSCRLDGLFNFTFDPITGYRIVADSTIGDGWNGGMFYAQSLTGDEYYVEYFSHLNLPEEVQTLLQNPNTREQGLVMIFENLLLSGRPSLKSIESKEYREDEILHVKLIHQAENSSLFTLESTYIFLKEDFFYFVTGISPEITVTGAELPSVEGMMSGAPSLYAECEFSR